MFDNYDSSKFATLEESITHSKTNPFLASNFNAKLLINDYIVVEPNSTLKTFLEVYSDTFIEFKLEEKYHYKPEKLSLDLYGTTEFGFLLMLINKINTPLEFNSSTIKKIPVNLLFQIESFLLNNESRTFNILKPIYD